MILYYVHDPMCSWCWGYRPVWQDLKSALPAGIKVVNVPGGLAPDNEEPMPVAMQKSIEGHWHTIQDMLGTRFNFDFWIRCKPRRDTYKACRAVLVAAAHGLEEPMIEAIQRAYYLDARNPSDIDTLVELATELGIDGQAFRTALQSEETDDLFKLERSLAQYLHARGFPSLRLKVDAEVYPITVDYKNHQVSLEEILRFSATS